MKTQKFYLFLGLIYICDKISLFQQLEYFLLYNILQNALQNLYSPSFYKQKISKLNKPNYEKMPKIKKFIEIPKVPSFPEFHLAQTLNLSLVGIQKPKKLKKYFLQKQQIILNILILKTINFLRMGNQICRVQKQSVSLSIKKSNELGIQTQGDRNELLKSTGEENIQSQDESFDQCSPSTKYDIGFLNSSIRASEHDRTQDQENDSSYSQYPYQKDSVKNYFNQPFFQIFHMHFQRKLESSVRRSLQEWSQNVQTAKQTQNKHGLQRKSKLDALKDFGEFLSKKPLNSADIKISGDTLYKLRQQPIEPYYQIDKKIGEGSFGSVYIGKCRRTNQPRAIKILKKKIMGQKAQQALLSQTNILKKMDHINIIKLFDVFYYKNFFYVVTEYCQGGTLYSTLKTQKFPEPHIAILMKQILSAISYMHKMKIAHRDLKLDNIVLVKQLNSSKQSGDFKGCVKIIDFGLAQKVLYPLNNPTGIVGTLDFMAPEIFQGYYSCHSDIWSCGVILTILLIGCNPFKKKSQNQTIKEIRYGKLDFSKSEWRKVSAGAKDLIEKMLEKKSSKRITVDQILNHPWMKQTTQQSFCLDNSQIVIKNFNNYNRGNTFLCYIKNFLLSRKMTQSLRQQMALIFSQIDTDSSGMLQRPQLLQLLSLVTGTPSHDLNIEHILSQIDQNHSGMIDFQQFLLCMTNDSLTRNNMYIGEAFEYFDRDGTGYIERDELMACIQGWDQGEIKSILGEADFDGDGRISRDEFIGYMMRINV